MHLIKIHVIARLSSKNTKPTITMAPINDTITAAETINEEIYDEKVKGADAVFAYANATATLLNDETNKLLLRKIDTRVLPWLYGLYILQYIDKGV